MTRSAGVSANIEYHTVAPMAAHGCASPGCVVPSVVVIVRVVWGSYGLTYRLGRYSTKSSLGGRHSQSARMRAFPPSPSTPPTWIQYGMPRCASRVTLAAAPPDVTLQPTLWRFPPGGD